MAMSGHKSVKSLAIYQRVHEDEKLMMGLCLNYCLITPITLPKQIAEPIPQPKLQEEPPANLETEKAVIPYTGEVDVDPNFDLMQLINETIDEVNDEDLVMAATQCEQAMIQATKKLVSNSSNTSMMRMTMTTTFTNCTFGTINNLNIHIHKN